MELQNWALYIQNELITEKFTVVPRRKTKYGKIVAAKFHFKM